MEQLKRTGHVGMLSYALQQIQQFRGLGEEFAMQHRDSQYMGALEEDILEAVLAATPAEKRLRGLSPEEMAAALSEEQATRLRELLERKPSRTAEADNRTPIPPS